VKLKLKYFICAYSWTGESDNLHLNKINVDLSGKKLVMIVGPVASGKSSFLQALLGELKISSGELKISGSITFSCQDAWIFPGTLRQNILFGNEYDADFYDDVVTACALGSDFHQFPQGDETYIGEKSCLSGGQQSRINLARSLYKNSDIYLIDDALSAVDNRVSSHIFQKCIKQYLDSKLVILVTHQIQYIPKADHIIVMNKGSILSQGTYQDLVEEGIDFLRLITSEVEPDLYRKASITKLEAASFYLFIFIYFLRSRLICKNVL
jgi:ATP-binding cassette subfamily C (CFTR/MRP) protein 4